MYVTLGLSALRACFRAAVQLGQPRRSVLDLGAWCALRPLRPPSVLLDDAHLLVTAPEALTLERGDLAAQLADLGAVGALAKLSA
jgi:hypothetical protein